MTHKVFVTDGISDIAIERLKPLVDVTVDHTISAEDLAAVIGDYDALAVRSRTKVTAALLEHATNLRVVGRAGAGVDNIDIDACTARDIIVVNSPLAVTIAVAELTIGLMLALARHIAQADASMKRGEWNKKLFRGVELYGKTLGLVAMGRIGAAVAGRASAMGMRVIAYDPYLADEEIRLRQAEPSTLFAMLERADFVSVHTPLTPETKGLVGAEAFEHMRPGAFLLCAARGGVVDEAALLDALNEGKLAGAALDVFETEPPGDAPLVNHPHVIATPHMGAQTWEAQIRAGEDIAQELIAALNDKPLRSRVN